VIDMANGVVLVPVSVQMLPQAFTGAWVTCDAVRFVVRTDGTFDIEFRRDGAA